jgi:hypothetical protein
MYMLLGRYRLTRDLIALFDRDGRLCGETIPAESVVELQEQIADDARLVPVQSGLRKALVFVEDLRDKAVHEEESLPNESMIAC